MNDQFPLQIENKNPHYNLGIVLSGGGAKGFAHIGAMRALAEHNLKPNIISGVSAGAILGAFFCDGFEPDEVLEICSKEKFTSLAEFVIPKSGIMTMHGLRRFLKRNLRSKTFEELPTPLVVTATDLDACKPINFSSGNLADAICASSSIPIVFTPWQIKGTHYIDGGVLSNLPVRPIRQECKYIIGINVSAHLGSDYKKTLIGIADRSFRLMLKANTLIEQELCDLYIESEEEKYYNIFDIENIKEISQLGYHAMEQGLLTNTRNLDLLR
ncbi:MAG: patatin-like phospholipase family protein [Bacteroidales bacterium]|nr:patatin-like phospholipase family protein [Bacteroidales bacterium]